MTDLNELAARERAAVVAIHNVESKVLEALTDAYHEGALQCVNYSAAYDVTIARMVALDKLLSHLPRPITSDAIERGDHNHTGATHD